MNNQHHYFTRDERGYHCYIRGIFQEGNYGTQEQAEAFMKGQGLVFETRTASDSGKPTWWWTDKPMTQADMMAQVKGLGLTCRVKDGEIRVNYRGGTEDTAYYTNDRQDAVDTAKHMKQVEDEAAKEL